MKHPRYEVLQDYFENVLNPYQENLVKEHLLNCDECTVVLSHFVMIETKLKNQIVMPKVSLLTQEKIFASAKSLLQEKQMKLKSHATQKVEHKIRQEKIAAYWQEWKESIFPQIKIPALQISSLALVLIVLVSVEKSQGDQEDVFEPLNDEVQVFTYLDDAKKAED